MKITHAGTQLTDLEVYPAKDVQLSGQEVIDVVQPIDVQSKNYDRRNQSVSLQFSARKEFGSLKTAQVDFLTQFSGLTKQGTCEIECGGPGGGATDLAYIPRAVLAGSDETINGLEVVRRYSIVGPRIQTYAP